MDAPPPGFPYYFDEAAGQRHIDFMQKFCRQSKGKSGKKLLKFELFQLAKLQLVFGWKDKKTGKRRFRVVIDFRGRKCGKSTETAAVMHDMLINDGENGPEVYCAANSRDQADQVFSEAVNMRLQSPALRSIERKRQTDIYCQMNFGKIKKLAAKTDNLDGLNASFVAQDEVHAQKDSKLYDVLIQSQAEREQPIYWMISTNGFLREAFLMTSMSMLRMWRYGMRAFTIIRFCRCCMNWTTATNGRTRHAGRRQTRGSVRSKA